MAQAKRSGGKVAQGRAGAGTAVEALQKEGVEAFVERTP